MNGNRLHIFRISLHLLFGVFTTVQMTSHAESPLEDMDQLKVYNTTPPAQTSDNFGMEQYDRVPQMSKDTRNSNDFEVDYDNGENNGTTDEDSITKNNDEYDFRDDDVSGSDVTRHGPSTDLPVSNETLVQTLVDEFKAQCDSNHTETLYEMCSQLLSNILLLTGGNLPAYFQDVFKLYVCGDVLYNTFNSLCCGGRIFPLTSHQENCCNNTMYSRRTHLCCDDNLFMIFPETRLKCCGRFLYDPRQMFCCGDVLYQREQKSMCCGVTVIDIRCYNCVNSTAIQISNDSLCTFRSKNRQSDQFILGSMYRHRTKMPVLAFTTDKQRSVNQVRTHLAVPKMKNRQSDQFILESMYRHQTNIPVLAFTTDKPRAVDQEPTLLVYFVCFIASAAPTVMCLMCMRRKKTYLLRWHCLSSSTTTEKKYPINDHWNSSTPSLQLDSYEEIGEPLEPLSHLYKTREQLNTTEVPCIDFNEIEETIEPFLRPGYDIYKNKNTQPINYLFNHFVNAQTQTSESKAFNKHTVFGTKYQHSAILTSENQTFKMPRSDVEVVFPCSLLQPYGLEVHGSTFSNIIDIRRRFDIPNDEELASPVTEYHVTGHDKFPDHACVKVPFIGNDGLLMVYKFDSDEGITKITKLLPVPRKTSGNEDLDIFYDIEGSTCLIYTRSFSGFLCTSNHHRPLIMRVYAYASHKRLPVLPNQGRPQNEVRIRMYIVDELLQFKDYKQRIEDIEGTSGRCMKEAKQLRLLDIMVEDDLLEVTLTPMDDSAGPWMHKPSFHNINEPMFAASEVITMAELVQPCPECPRGHLLSREMPYHIEWYLINRKDILPPDTFQCEITVTNRRFSSNNDKKTTTLLIDELPLHSENRLLPVEMDIENRLLSIKDYVLRMDGNSQSELMKQLGQRKDDAVEKVFETLERCYTPEDLFINIVGAFSAANLYEHLDVLRKRNMISDDFNKRPVQLVRLECETHNNAEPCLQASAHQLLNNDEPCSHLRANQRLNNVQSCSQASGHQSLNNAKPCSRVSAHKLINNVQACTQLGALQPLDQQRSNLYPRQHAPIPQQRPNLYPLQHPPTPQQHPSMYQRQHAPTSQHRPNMCPHQHASTHQPLNNAQAYFQASMHQPGNDMQPCSQSSAYQPQYHAQECFQTSTLNNIHFSEAGERQTNDSLLSKTDDASSFVLPKNGGDEESLCLSSLLNLSNASRSNDITTTPIQERGSLDETLVKETD